MPAGVLATWHSLYLCNPRHLSLSRYGVNPAEAGRLPSVSPSRGRTNRRSGSTDISRYGLAFHLPDKEFRYLRTVIVTAAVYRGFNSGLSALLLTFRHRAGVSPYTSPYGFAETCVFSKQSVGPLSCDSLVLQDACLRTIHHTLGAPLLPKLRGYFAEFLSQSSLDRLGILFPSTSVGLRYGHLRSP